MFTQQEQDKIIQALSVPKGLTAAFYTAGHPIKLNKHFESSQKLLKSSFVNEKFKKYSKVPKELLNFQTTKFTKT